ncbi:MAG: zinc-binding alcohol dehydrogenase [Spirochaetaceae bacterium]|nr:MAG: zinc-binding alcohol dehydrogenase [Spirochaetaceae bacterium]
MQVDRIVFTGQGIVEIESGTIDTTLQPREVLIETTCSLVSAGTELAALFGTHSKSDSEDPPAWLRFPSVPGYLVCGRIVEVGKDVTSVQVGQLVVAEGAGVWNSHCSHLVMDSGDYKLVPIADGVTDEEAVTTKLGSIAMTAPRVLHPQFGDTVVVFGLGLVGQIAARLAVLAGAGRVIAVDPLPERREIVSHSPGVLAVDPDGPVLRSQGRVGDRLAGFDHVIEASGHPDAFLQACEVARIRGKIAVLSSPHRTLSLRLYDHIHSKGLQILGAHGSVLPAQAEVGDRWTDGEQRRFFMQLLAEERIDVKPLITHRVPFTQAAEMYRGLKEDPRHHLGVLFYWNGFGG